MWINIANKTDYTDSKLQGIRLLFYKQIDLELKENIKKYCKWLRKRFWFPIRCNICIFSYSYFKASDKNDKDSYGDFYYCADDSLKINPSIWIPTGLDKIKRNPDYFVGEVIFRVTHELTHYYQWYFNQFSIRTNKSLEIEANKWANYLVNEYLNK